MESLISRRNLIVGAAAATAMLHLQKLNAQTASAGGNWFAMIQVQHKAILAQVAGVLADDAAPGTQRQNDLTYLSSLLLAHNTAEENTVYAALTTVGMWVPADLLYLEQSHGKVNYYDLITNAATLSGAAWVAAVTAIQTALIEHATVHEEGDYFPKLQAALTATQNATLTGLFQSYHGAVMAF